MSLIATTCMSLPPRGKTTTAFGSHEWLNSAQTGDVATPIGVRSGAESVNELTENWWVSTAWGLATHRRTHVEELRRALEPKIGHVSRLKHVGGGRGHSSVEVVPDVLNLARELHGGGFVECLGVWGLDHLLIMLTYVTP